MSFWTLALVSLVALAGPLLAYPKGWRLPVMLGQLVAGIALGDTGSRTLHPHDRTFTFLADVGFALIMFVAGSHVPVRDPRLRPALRIGALRAAAVGLVSVPLGFAVAQFFGTGHAALYAVLMASSSAALILPIVNSLKLEGDPIRELLPQVAIADTACIVALPLAIQPSHAGRAAVGALAIVGTALVLFLVLRELDRRGIRQRLHDISEDRKFALELRLNLAMLFALAALAVQTHVSIMLAGFSFGLVTAAIGTPRRLARQLFALSDGFLGPLFFVWLGASLDLRQLSSHPSYIGLGIVLGAGAVLTHVVLRVTGQPLPTATLAAAQLGVPVAAATLGTELHLLKPGESGALILGALITIAAAILSGRASSAGADETVAEGTGQIVG